MCVCSGGRGGVDFPACITGHMTRGRALQPGGGVYISGGGKGSASRGRGLLPREGICIQREKWSASGGGGAEVLDPGKRGSASGGRGCIQWSWAAPVLELGKRTVRILLECFLVFIVNNCLFHSEISKYGAECKQTTFIIDLFSIHTH